MAVSTVWTEIQMVPRPSIISMRKKSTAHTTDPGILAMAAGYATNANAVPEI